VRLSAHIACVDGQAQRVQCGAAGVLELAQRRVELPCGLGYQALEERLVFPLSDQ
jgi:hypothetical protein